MVLPTGTGKTETMLAALIYRRLPRVLVMVPSDALRGQISAKFLTLGVLPLASVVPQEIAKPRVAVISTGIRSIDEAKAIIKQREKIKRQTIEYRRLQHRKLAA